MELKRTPLYELHLMAGARMVEFAGYEMPLRYPEGTIAEHSHTRNQASLFDVSHMGVIEIHGSAPAAVLEQLLPSDVVGLGLERLRYSFLTNEAGGIIDDVVLRNRGDQVMLIANASRKAVDLNHLSSRLGGSAEALPRPDMAILAIQGPASEAALTSVMPSAAELRFMTGSSALVAGVEVLVSRSGYTGEDGFELMTPASAAEQVAETLLRVPPVRWAGLGARDTLRLEAGLCLYGQDLDETTSPVEAGLAWAIQKRRRQEGGFLGWERIKRELEEGPSRVRMGILPNGRAPVRPGAKLLSQGREVGTVTSGGYGPTMGGPVAMGYVPTDLATADTELTAVVRDKELACRVVELPFVPHRYRMGTVT